MGHAGIIEKGGKLESLYEYLAYQADHNDALIVKSQCQTDGQSAATV